MHSDLGVFSKFYAILAFGQKENSCGINAFVLS